MKTFTVFGFYESNGQIFAETFEAYSATNAMRLVAQASTDPDDLQLIGAVECPYEAELDCSGDSVCSAADYLKTGCGDVACFIENGET